MGRLNISFSLQHFFDVHTTHVGSLAPVIHQFTRIRDYLEANMDQYIMDDIHRFSVRLNSILAKLNHNIMVFNLYLNQVIT